DRIFLVQLATRARTAIVDPLVLPDLSPVGALLADPGVEKVFHDADYDLRILDRDYGFRAVRVFDTRIAAQLAGEPAVGLAALLEKYLGVKLAKEHQKADWSRRPLPPAMLEYAAADTQHLPALRDALRDRLSQLGRLAWAEEECARLESLRWTGAPNGTDAFLRLKGARAGRPATQGRDVRRTPRAAEDGAQPSGRRTRPRSGRVVRPIHARGGGADHPRPKRSRRTRPGGGAPALADRRARERAACGARL